MNLREINISDKELSTYLEAQKKITGLINLNTIQSANGREINVFDPKPEMFDIEDIAIALSKVSRFNGNLLTDRPYSVAQHSIWVCEQLLSRGSQHAFSGLMHDATEAYLCDMPAPIKQHLPDYKKLEAKLDQVLANKFRYLSPKPVHVNIVDLEALYWEYAMFKIEVRSDLILDPQENVNRFLELYEKLKP